jgi:hypothetical protein
MRMLVPLRDGTAPRRPYNPVTYDRSAGPERGGREDAAYLAAMLGLVSVMALAASFLWAHHWGPLAYTIVGFWAITTGAAFVFAVMSFRGRAPARGLAVLALACVSVSVLAIGFTGVAFAAGYDPTGLCGGG